MWDTNKVAQDNYYRQAAVTSGEMEALEPTGIKVILCYWLEIEAPLKVELANLYR